MAAVDIYTDAKVEAGKHGNPANIMPGQVFGFACTFEVAIADDDASIYRIASLGANMVPLMLLVANDAAIDVTTIDVGLYRTLADGGAVVDLDCFADGIDSDTGAIFGSDLDGLVSLPIADCGKKLWEITAVVAAKTYTEENHPKEFDLAITAKSEPGAAGTISVRGLFIQG